VGPSGLARTVSDDEICVFPDDSFTIAAGSSHDFIIHAVNESRRNAHVKAARHALFLLLIAALLPALLPAQTSNDFDQRAREIVGKMTLDEKLTELHGIRDATHYRYVPGIPRLGIPEFRITNGPAGAGPGGAGPQPKATALPAPIGLAATWDPQLSREYGQIVGKESLLVGNGLVEAPTINIARNPQNGRTFEGFGEDPYLTTQLSVANIQGIQSEHIIANVKHYAANNQETDRFVIDEKVDERALREIYLPAFEASIKEGKSASLMCAYNKVNGTFACENAPLLNDILKKEWGFTGFVTSDFNATHSSAESALAGLDLEMPTGKYFSDQLRADVESGKVPMSVIDDKLIRRFRTMMEFGVWDNVPMPKPVPEKEDGAVARRIAEQAVVLLKNTNGLLPLKAGELKSIALIGDIQRASTGGGGSSHVQPLYTVRPIDGIKAKIGPGVTLNALEGGPQAAADVARSADVAIVMVGDNDREGRDQSLDLPGSQNEIVSAVAAANPRTIVVLKTGSAVLMPWLDSVAAVVEAWYPGEEDGNAVASVLFGDVNPSAKLPITFPKRVEDTFAANPEQYPGVDKIAKYTEGIFVGYRYYDEKKIEPLFPFGFGLSYTTFAYKNLRVNPIHTVPRAVSVEFDVTNTGKVEGAAIAQVYVALPSSSVVPQPPKQLKAFQKVQIAPGKTAHVRLTLNDRAFEYWDVTSYSWKPITGSIGVMAGSSSRDFPLKTQITLR
jgi:beta-glucosidase